MSKILTKYMGDVRRNLAGLGLREREDVLQEIEQHLRDRMSDLRAADPGLSEDEAALQATHAFGEPHELAVRHGPGGGVVRRGTGEVVLDIAVLTSRGVGRGVKAVGRGARHVLKWTAISVASLLAAALLVTLVILVAYREPISDGIEKGAEAAIVYSQPIYHEQGMWGMTEPQARPATGSFEVTDAHGKVDLVLRATPNTGCLSIVLLGPDGAPVYDNGAGCTATSHQQVVTQKGVYRIQYTYAAFTGVMQVDAYAWPAS